MKKEQMELKEVIKAAILEAFAEMYGVATLDDTDDSAPEDEDKESSNSKENSGGTPGTNKPKPNVGVGTFNLR